MTNIAFGQLYYPADPFSLLFIEKKMLESSTNPGSLMIRPQFLPDIDLSNNWVINYRSELFYNTNAPNLENTSDRWIGKGMSSFNSIHISYYGKILAGSIEPFFFINQNKKYDYPNRLARFSRLNDNPAHKNSPYKVLNLRETQLYLHYKGFGVGWSNANMWWGSGIHSSLMMTNNTTGFAHIMLGTLREKKFGKIGFNFRYIFTKLDKKNPFKPFYNAIALALTYYSDPIITVGLTKAALAGGAVGDRISWRNALFFTFSSSIFAPKDNVWLDDDHTVAGYIETIFPKSKLKLFLEIGRNDIAWSIDDLLLAPEYSTATVIGMRKYEIFNISDLFFGMEYLKQYYGTRIYRHPTGPWNRGIFDYSSYNGRYWGPHSGTDSDDFYIYLGWMKNKFSMIYAFNYERHGIQIPISIMEIDGRIEQPHNGWPEVKFEFKLDLRYNLNGYRINLFIEREILKNFEFADKTRKGNVIWVGIERDINKLFSK